MSETALELVLRVAGERLATERCGTCGASLEGGALRLCDQAGESMVLEVVCSACSHAARIEIRPEADEGIARVG